MSSARAPHGFGRLPPCSRRHNRPAHWSGSRSRHWSRPRRPRATAKPRRRARSAPAPSFLGLIDERFLERGDAIRTGGFGGELGDLPRHLLRDGERVDETFEAGHAGLVGIVDEGSTISTRQVLTGRPSTELSPASIRYLSRSAARI